MPTIVGELTKGAVFNKLVDRTNVLTAPLAKATTYTALVTDDLILCSSTFTLTLYTAVGNSGRQITIKNVGTGTITVDGNASETIDGSLTAVISVQYVSITLLSDGSNWSII